MSGYLDFGGGAQHDVVRVFQALLFEPLRLGADQQVEMRRQVASQQRFVGRDVEQEGERFHVEARLQHLHTLEDSVVVRKITPLIIIIVIIAPSHHQSSMNAAASQVGRVFR